MRTARPILLGFLTLLSTSAVQLIAAPLGSEFTYQGQLKEAGIPVYGTADMIFTLWNDPTAGGQVGPTLTFNGVGANPPPVTVAGGLFTVALDFGSAALDGNARWLNIQVRYPSGAGVYTTLTPRQKLTGTPYALYALASPGSGLWTNSGTNTYNTTTGFVGVNRSSPVTGSDYFSVHAPTSTGYGGMYIKTDGGTSLPFYGYSSGAQAAWTYLDTTSGDWRVYNGGDRMTVTDEGLVGIGTDSPTTKLHVTTSTGDGITANTTDAFSVGVHGTGTTAGVLGSCGSSDGAGVQGIDNTPGAAGVRGDSDSGAGVAGYTVFGTGVYGQVGTGGWGVYGSNGGSNSDGYAGYFNGRMHVNGTLSKNGGSFKIDHPLDPSNKYLSHSFVESPDMMNIYNGIVVTDDAGYATVTMPAWFQALNQDFRYQLTVIDDSDEFVLAKIVSEIEHNSFALRTSRPQTKVSWQVTGIRHDAWAQQNRIPIEEVKPQSERGRYLNPEVFGRPRELGVTYTVEQARRAVQATPAAAQPNN